MRPAPPEMADSGERGELPVGGSGRSRDGDRPGAARLDVTLVERGLARSRASAARMIDSGLVRVGGEVSRRASRRVLAGEIVELADDEQTERYVSRSAGKLLAALDGFGIEVAGRLALDVGASTGGFTQVLLERGARAVIALDVGHGQLVPELRADPRVRVVEGENARFLTPGRLTELSGEHDAPGLIVVDVSFIPLGLVLPALTGLADPEVELILLVKPQFEVGRGAAPGGIVADREARHRAIRSVLDDAFALGLASFGILSSPVVGTHGNQEYLMRLSLAPGRDPSEWSGAIDALD